MNVEQRLREVKSNSRTVRHHKDTAAAAVSRSAHQACDFQEQVDVIGVPDRQIDCGGDELGRFQTSISLSKFDFDWVTTFRPTIVTSLAIHELCVRIALLDILRLDFSPLVR